MFANLTTEESFENLSESPHRGFIQSDGVGAGGGIRTHVAQWTTGFQALLSRLGLCVGQICSLPEFPHRIRYALGDPGDLGVK